MEPRRVTVTIKRKGKSANTLEKPPDIEASSPSLSEPSTLSPLAIPAKVFQQYSPPLGLGEHSSIPKLSSEVHLRVLNPPPYASAEVLHEDVLEIYSSSQSLYSIQDTDYLAIAVGCLQSFAWPAVDSSKVFPFYNIMSIFSSPELKSNLESFIKRKSEHGDARELLLGFTQTKASLQELINVMKAVLNNKLKQSDRHKIENMTQSEVRQPLMRAFSDIFDVLILVWTSQELLAFFPKNCNPCPIIHIGFIYKMKFVLLKHKDLPNTQSLSDQFPRYTVLYDLILPKAVDPDILNYLSYTIAAIKYSAKKRSLDSDVGFSQQDQRTSVTLTPTELFKLKCGHFIRLSDLTSKLSETTNDFFITHEFEESQSFGCLECSYAVDRSDIIRVLGSSSYKYVNKADSRKYEYILHHNLIECPDCKAYRLSHMFASDEPCLDCCYSKIKEKKILSQDGANAVAAFTIGQCAMTHCRENVLATVPEIPCNNKLCIKCMYEYRNTECPCCNHRFTSRERRLIEQAYPDVIKASNDKIRNRG